MIHWRGRYLVNTGDEDTVTMTVSLYEGATLRASFTPTPSKTAFGNHTYTLSEAEANAITAYTDLRIRSVMTRTATGLDRQQFRVSDEKLEVPDLVVGHPASRRHGVGGNVHAMRRLGHEGQFNY